MDDDDDKLEDLDARTVARIREAAELEGVTVAVWLARAMARHLVATSEGPDGLDVDAAPIDVLDEDDA